MFASIMASPLYRVGAAVLWAKRQTTRIYGHGIRVILTFESVVQDARCV